MVEQTVTGETVAGETAARIGNRIRTVMMVAVLASMLATTGCFVSPIDQGPNSATPSAHLRDGPQTAMLPSADVEPIAANPRSTLPATVDSLRYGKVTVTDTSRIIAVDQNGTLGTIVFSLGLGSRVVGRDTSTAFPSAGKLPVVTDHGHTLNAESVLALAPTVLLVTDATLPQTAVDQIRSSGVTVVVFSSARNLATNDALIHSVAGALGVPAQGVRLSARTDAQLASARRLVPSPSGDPVMAFIYIRGPSILYLLGPGSGADDLIANLGGRDAAGHAHITNALTQVNAEVMLAADPNVILVMTEGAATVGGPNGVLALPGIADTDAGRHRRVVQMDQTKILAFGPDVGEVISSLAEAIYT